MALHRPVKTSQRDDGPVQDAPGVYWRVTEFTVSRPENNERRHVHATLACYADADARGDGSKPGALLALRQVSIPAHAVPANPTLEDVYRGVVAVDPFFAGALPA